MLKFITENWGYIMAGIIYIISIISALITFIKTKSKEKAVEEIKEATDNFIKEAEKLQNLTGEERKAWVMTRAKEFAGKNMSTIEIGNYIDSQIELTNHVNTNKSNKGESNNE